MSTLRARFQTQVKYWCPLSSFFVSADKNHRYWGVFWIDATSNASILQSIKRIASALDVEQELDAVHQILTDTRQKWLMVFDNLDDYDVPVGNYFPTGVRGDIIITSRDRRLQQASTMGHEKIGEIDRDDAIALLRLMAYGLGSSDEDKSDGVGNLVDALECSPLTIRNAAEIIRSNNFSPEEYLKYLADEGQAYSSKYPTRSEVDTAKDSGYVSSREDAPTISLTPMDRVDEGNDLQSIRSLSTFVDLGEDRRIWSISTFALNIIDSLSPDICDAIHDREEARLIIEEALQAFSYSVEREDQFPKLSPERQASTFVRQQNV